MWGANDSGGHSPTIEHSSENWSDSGYAGAKPMMPGERADLVGEGREPADIARNADRLKDAPDEFCQEFDPREEFRAKIDISDRSWQRVDRV